MARSRRGRLAHAPAYGRARALARKCTCGAPETVGAGDEDGPRAPLARSWPPIGFRTTSIRDGDRSAAALPGEIAEMCFIPLCAAPPADE